MNANQNEDVPLKNIFPAEWSKKLNSDNTLVDEYRNLEHFKHVVSQITQKQDNNCGVTYSKALDDLIKGTSVIDRGKYDIIKNKVKNNLLKRGLISDNVYESYKYAVEGDIWDVAKVVAQDPMCCLVPNETYTNHFYELFISVSYPSHISNETVTENMAKILATVELLEQEHYYCKLTLIMPNIGCNTGNGKPNYLGLIPLFSHKDVKTIEQMSSVLNDRLLRKFFFALWEDRYGDSLAGGYGHAEELPLSIRPVNLDECELASSILDQVLEPSKGR